MLTNEEAWNRLPGAPEKAQSLPGWARLLAGPLPLTTARMLELDSLHRTGERLAPILRGLVRWAAADANRCDYAKAVAAADLRWAGVTVPALQRFLSDPNGLPPSEQAAMAFARKMMREAHAVTDQEMQQLLDFFGEEQVVALVALLAHASFQDRIILATQVRVEPEDPLPPLTVQFAKLQPKQTFGWSTSNVKGKQASLAADGIGACSEWLGLQEDLNWQRTRPGRIRVPSKEEVRKRVGEGYPWLWQLDINWSRVCIGNQPELTDAWFACVAAFRHEARLDRLFEQALFWIVTQSLRCFY